MRNKKKAHKKAIKEKDKEIFNQKRKVATFLKKGLELKRAIMAKYKVSPKFEVEKGAAIDKVIQNMIYTLYCSNKDVDLFCLGEPIL